MKQMMVKITDESCIGAARRSAIMLAKALALDEISASNLAIITTELASNLHKYAQQTGQLLLQPLRIKDTLSIEILAIDKGPGIANISQSLQDGYSTKGSAGTGLGAVARLATHFNIYSTVGAGTLVWAQLWLTPLAKQSYLKIGNISLPKLNEKECGDAWTYEHMDNRALFLVADGLGHGPDAATASRLACQVFSENKHAQLAYIINAIDKALCKTRGAAIAVAEINFEQHLLKFAGLGNIAGILLTEDKRRHLMSRDGTAGLNQSLSIQESVYPWNSDSLLIMHSDGLATRWDLSAYNQLTSRHPAIMAGILYRDFTRGYDDVTVIVARE